MGLAALGGVAQSLAEGTERGAAEALSLLEILLLATVIGSLYGIVVLVLGSRLVRWTGGWLGGRGSLAKLRVAIGWANVPLVASLALTLLLIAAVGPLAFAGEVHWTKQPEATWNGLLVMAHGFAVVVLNLWSAVILVKGIGEVQGFSAWRGFVNLLLSSVVVLVPLFVMLYAVLE